MKLVACPKCHTQYDVSLVDADSVTCRCGEKLSTAARAAVDAEVCRCSSCGAVVASDAKLCSFCGSEIVRDDERLSLICPECFARNTEESRFCAACGVSFEPQPLPEEAVELPCPVCTVLMPPRTVGGVVVNECPHCHGLWVAGNCFETLVKRAIAARQKRGAPLQPPRASGSNPARQQVVYRKCPVCDAFMQRRNFQRTSGVILDWCRKHGTYLDADELEEIAGFIASGAAVTTGSLSVTVGGARQAAAAPDWAADAAAAEARARAELSAQMIMGRRHGARHRGLLGGALSLLQELLD